MKNKVIIVKDQQKTATCILSDDRLYELRFDKAEGNILHHIYIGKVKKVLKNLEACFVDIGGTNCFLAFSEYISTDEHHPYPIEGEELLVQVIREGLKTKEPAVSCKLQIGGTYLVLTSYDQRISISKKISNPQKRNELKKVLTDMVNSDSPFGIIIRTNCEGADIIQVQQEYIQLSSVFSNILQYAHTRTCFSCLYQEQLPYIKAVQNLNFNELDSIITDDSEIYKELSDALPASLLVNVPIRFYEDSMLSLSKLYGLSAKIQEATAKKVWLKSGGYIIIEQTEAFNVIDVNSGKYDQKKTKEWSVHQTNREAAFESARQIHLRNLSGIILIDFINESPALLKELIDYVKECLSKDKIKTSFIDVTKLGLFEITRQKREKSLQEQLNEI